MIADRNAKTPAAKASGDGQRHERAERKARRDAIGTELRRAYDEAMREPVPDSFKALFASMPAGRGKKR